MSATLPWLYLKGISTGDMSEALSVLAQWADDNGPTSMPTGAGTSYRSRDMFIGGSA